MLNSFSEKKPNALSGTLLESIPMENWASVLQNLSSIGILEGEGAGIFEDMIAKQILKKHKFKIWKGENDNFWHTYLPDENRKNGRKPVKRKNQKDLEREIVKYYMQLERNSGGFTVKELYLEWLDYKELHTRSSGTMKRLSSDWQKFYEDDEISKMQVRDLTKLYLDNWVHTQIKTYQLKKKAYYNMSMPLRQMLAYAKEKGYIDKNPFETVKISARILQSETKKKDNEQVFLVDEVPLIMEELERHYRKNSKNTAPLAVKLAFETGLRVGELAAIRYEDISGQYLHVQRQEVKVYSRREEGIYRLTGFDVVEHTKSDAGDRNVYLTDEARAIIAEVMQRNVYNGEPCDGFLFVKNGQRIKTRAIISQLERCLNWLSMEYRSIHKARKTFVSALIDGGVNINEVRNQVGHADVRTTYNCYCYNRYGEEETNKKIQNALHPENIEKISEIKVEQNSEGITGNQKIISFPGNKKTGKPSKIKASR